MKKDAQGDICKRIAQVRLEATGPRGKAAFAKKLGLSASTYDYYESTRVPPADVLVRIADLAGVDLYWLLTGQAAKEPLPAGNPAIQRAAKLLAEHPDAAAPLAAFLEILAETLKFPGKETPGETQPAPAPPLAAAGVPGGWETPADSQAAAASGLEKDRWIPVLGRSAAGVPQFWSHEDAAKGITMLSQLIERHARRAGRQVRPGVAAAGEGELRGTAEIITLRTDREAETAEFINAPAIKTRYNDAFAVRIDGESMTPDIRHGDLVILSPSASAVDGRPAVVQLARQIGVTCKLYRREGQVVHLVPINEQFAPQSFPARQVVWALRVLARVRG